jgi:hypothetical protein
VRYLRSVVKALKEGTKVTYHHSLLGQAGVSFGTTLRFGRLPANCQGSGIPARIAGRMNFCQTNRFTKTRVPEYDA